MVISTPASIGAGSASAKGPTVVDRCGGPAALALAPVEAADGTDRIPTVPHLDDLFESWQERLRVVEGRAEATCKAYRIAVANLLQDSGAQAPGDLTPAAIERHLKRLALAGRSAATRAGALHAIRGFCRYLLGHGLLATNPTSSIHPPRQYRREFGVLTVEEVKRLIDPPKVNRRRPVWIRLRNASLWGVVYAAGLRASEAGQLRVEDVKWDEEVLLFSVLVVRAKSSYSDERIPLPSTVSRVLGAYLSARSEAGVTSPLLYPSMRRGRALDGGQVHRMFKERVVEAGIETRGRRLSPHILRHSRATHLLRAGVDIRTVQAMLRHASLTTTARYLHSDEQRRLSAVRRDPLEGKRRAAPSPGTALRELLGEFGSARGPFLETPTR